MRRLSIRGQLLRQALMVVVAIFVLVPVWVLILMATDGSLTGYPDGLPPAAGQPQPRPVRRGDRSPVPRVSTTSACCATAWSWPGRRRSPRSCFGASMAYAFARLRFPGEPGRAARGAARRVPAAGGARPAAVHPVHHARAQRPRARCVRAAATRRSRCRSSTRRSPCRCAIWLMRAAFRATPVDLEEAAFVDGASRFTAFRKITLPIAMPSLLVAALVSFLLAYTEFALAWLFINSDENITLAMVLAEAQTGFYSSNWGLDRGPRAADDGAGRRAVHRPPAGAAARCPGGGRRRLNRLARRGTLRGMCRSIRQLRKGDDAGPATTGEAEAAALQYVRKISGFRASVVEERRGVRGRGPRDRPRDRAAARVARDEHRRGPDPFADPVTRAAILAARPPRPDRRVRGARDRRGPARRRRPRLVAPPRARRRRHRLA